MSNNHRFSTTTATSSTSSSTASTTLPSSSSLTLTPSSPIDKFPPSSSLWDSDSDSDGWQDMPIVHTDSLRGGLDEEDQRRYHYRVNEEGSSSRLGRETGGNVGEGSGSGSKGGGNATGTTLDTDEYGYRWRANPMQSKTPSSTEHSFEDPGKAVLSYWGGTYGAEYDPVLAHTWGTSGGFGSAVGGDEGGG